MALKALSINTFVYIIHKYAVCTVHALIVYLYLRINLLCYFRQLLRINGFLLTEENVGPSIDGYVLHLNIPNTKYN